MKPLILASSSPRRQQLLKEAGIAFAVDSPNIVEDLSGDEPPDLLALNLAQSKAQAVAPRHPDSLILAADTLVVLHGKTILGKPQDAKDAERMLTALSGNIHTVMTAFVVLDTTTQKINMGVVQTHVRFRTLSTTEIQTYIETTEPFDKAGAYAIQGEGRALIETIEGDFTNVVGLPMNAVLETLNALA